MLVTLDHLARSINYDFFSCEDGAWLLTGWEGQPEDIDVTGIAYGDLRPSMCRTVARSLVHDVGPCVIVDEDAMRRAMWDAIEDSQDVLSQMMDLLDEQIGGEVTVHHYGSRVTTDAAAKRKTKTDAAAAQDQNTRGARTDIVTGSETYTYPPSNAGLTDPATRQVTEAGQQVDTASIGARSTTVEEDPHTDTHTEVAHDDRTERILTPQERSRVISEYMVGVYSTLRQILMIAVEEGKRRVWGL